MLWTALQDPDPVLIFENVMLYNMTGQIDAEAGPVDITKAAVRREGTDLSLITYGGSLFKTLDAAEELAADGISAEVIDLRTLRPLDDATILASLAKTRRAVIVDEGWRSGSLSAEIMARIMERGFWSLDAPVARVLARTQRRQVIGDSLGRRAISLCQEPQLASCFGVELNRPSQARPPPRRAAPW